MCSRDRSRVYGNCSTTTARFLRVAVTTYFYSSTRTINDEGGEGGIEGLGRGLSSDAEAKPTGERPARGETTGPWRCTLVEQRIYILCVCASPVAGGPSPKGVSVLSRRPVFGPCYTTSMFTAPLPEVINITHSIDSSYQRRHTELAARESLRLAPQRGGEPLVAVAEALELARAHGLLLGVGALA